MLEIAKVNKCEHTDELLHMEDPENPQVFSHDTDSGSEGTLTRFQMIPSSVVWFTRLDDIHGTRWHTEAPGQAGGVD